MVIMRSFGIAETTSFFRIAAPSFYRLFRQSVVNPFPPCHKWQGDRNTVLLAKPYGLWILQKDVLITVEGYFKPEEWTDSKSGEKRNRIVMVATKFYPTPEKEETSD